MQCLFINLDSRQDRRDFLDANFAANRLPGWRLERIAAFDAAHVEKKKVPGILRAAEKACFLSHVKALERSQADPHHTMILEDDAMFGKESCASIEGALGVFPDSDWDIIYTDVIILHAHLMVRLLSLRRELGATGEQQLLNLADLPFTAASAYVVNSRAKARLLNLVAEVGDLDINYDLYLRKLITEGKIRAFVTFPFVTTISALADTSNIQTDDTALSDAVWYAFRRLVWLHRDLAAAMNPLQAVRADFVDAESAAIARLVELILSPKFVGK